MEEETNGGLTTMETGGVNEEKSDALRIYVGGLGGTVKADDLKKTFSAPQLGTVTAVDVIRTKGRSFAYLEFLPSSDKGLAKLFSLYNGCMWKGGKLRLEKAKEHYLIRMKREWDEDSELVTDSSSHEVESESVNSQEKPNKFTDMENMQLRLYFPRLGKVKSLPFKGTGKHKYSFQRIQVPSHPSHFCDCEEHSGALNISKEQSFVNHEMESVGVNEEELNMMNSVMNKLLQKENISKVVSKSKVKPSVETQKVINSKDDLQTDEGEKEEEENHVSDNDDVMINLMDGSNNNDVENQVSDDDDDNLVINLSGRSNNGNLSALDSQEIVLQELRKSNDKPAQKTNKSQKRKNVEPNKRKDNVSDILEKKKRKILPSDTPEKKAGSDIIVQTNSESKTSQSSGKSSKKSVWKNLVSGSDNTTFQISDITTSVRDDDVIEPPGSDSLSGPLTEMETEEPKVSANDSLTDSLEIEEPKVSGDVEMLPESDTINDIEEPKVSGDEEMLPESDTINDIEEPKVLSSDANVLTKGASWLQKSSWTKMVGDSKVSSFSISHILPDVTFEKHESQLQVNIDFSSSMNKKRQTYNEEVKHDSEVKIDKNNEASTSSLNGKKQENDMDGEFTFMRSSSSMKEWQKTKAAISGSLKKKGNKK